MEGNHPSVCPGQAVSLSLREDSGLPVSVEEEQGIQPGLLGARSIYGSNPLYTASSSPSFCPAPPVLLGLT